MIRAIARAYFGLAVPTEHPRWPAPFSKKFVVKGTVVPPPHFTRIDAGWIGCRILRKILKVGLTHQGVRFVNEDERGTRLLPVLPHRVRNRWNYTHRWFSFTL